MTSPTDLNPYAAPAPVSDATTKPLPYDGSILLQGWKIFAGHWATIATVILIVWLPTATASSYLAYEIIDDSDGLLPLLLIPAEIIAESLGTGAVIAVAIAAAFGRQPSVGGAMRTSLGVWLKFAWTYFWCTLLIVLGFVFFVVPGIILAVRLALVDSVVVNEGEWGLSAMRRSFELTAGKFWPLARLYFVLGLISVASWSAYSLALEIFPSMNTWQADVFFSLAINMIEAYPSICVYLFYRRVLKSAASGLSSFAPQSSHHAPS